MKKRDDVSLKKRPDFTLIFLASFIFAIILFILPLQLSAKVTGKKCSSCHTMHNSQNGSSDANGPNFNLLKNVSGLSVDVCVGCHSAASDAVWKDGTTGAPIVWNQSEPTFNAQKGLAGGNFYWVAQGDDTKGHNVFGISNKDSNLSQAPGEDNSCGNTNACHFSLAVDPKDVPNPGPEPAKDKGGCTGCHIVVSHHTDHGNDRYRFLTGHDPNTDRHVRGVGDPNWESDPATGHNIYQGYNGPVVGETLADTKSISSFCGGCHKKFHTEAFIGTQSPWQRHPTDKLLPVDREYAQYKPYDNYNNLAPVAYTDILSPSNSTAVVMCLSCHRPHGSQYSDMLRWDYNGCNAGSSGPGCGCFVCHTEKDGA